ncbi:hypothetical protein [Nocardia bovistercoris]|uniref:Uncharacterized protein n=1 Tax=Nocardia bovistercoris TaxID=2785916 RepID=A0A931N3F5_9NOCA|nr:hypothetical protein [Nocardia bovistercoris]MBH0777814.1 hypothetical protein [Nocardia bovistercoris]
MRTGVAVMTILAVAHLFGGTHAFAAPVDSTRKCESYAAKWWFLEHAVFDGSGFLLADTAREITGTQRVPVTDLPANRLIVGPGQLPRGIDSPRLVITIEGAQGVTDISDISCALPDSNGR